MMKSFMQFLEEKKSSAKKTFLGEAVHHVGDGNSQNIRGVQFEEILRGIADKQHSFVKVLKKDDHDLLRVYNVRNEFNFEPNGENSPIRVEYHVDYEADNETTVQSLYDDFQAIRNAAQDIDDRQLNVYPAGGENENFGIYYDDETNLVFLVVGVQMVQVNRFHEMFKLLLRHGSNQPNGRINCDNQHVRQAIQFYAPDSGRALAVLGVFDSEAYHNFMYRAQELERMDILDDVNLENLEVRALEQPGNPGNQEDNGDEDNHPEDEEDPDDNPDIPDDDDVIDVQPVEEPQEEPEQQEHPQQDNHGEEVNGLRIIGADNGARPEGVNIVFTSKNLDDFKTEIRNFSRAAVSTFNQRPVVVKTIPFDVNDGFVKRLSFGLIVADTESNPPTVSFYYKIGRHPMMLKANLIGRDTSLLASLSNARDANWKKVMLKFVLNNYNNHNFDLLWDPDNTNWVQRNVAVQQNDPNQQRQQRQPRGERQPRQPRQQAAVVTDQQIETMERSIEQNLADQDDVIDVDVELFLNRNPVSRGRRLPREATRGQKWFVVKFPGVGIDPKTGSAGETFLNSLGLWNGSALKSGFEEVRRQYNDVQLFVSFDGRYLSIEDRRRLNNRR